MSPIKKNLESGNESSMSTTPARFRVAGAERSPLNNERPAYDRNLIEPWQVRSTGQVNVSKIAYFALTCGEFRQLKEFIKDRKIFERAIRLSPGPSAVAECIG